MRRLASLLFLLSMLPLTILWAATRDITRTEIVSADPRETTLSVSIDAMALGEQLMNLEPGANATDGLGVILAIAGQGTPRASVLHYELGEAMATQFALAEMDVATTTEELLILGEPAIWHDLRVVPLNFRPLMRDQDGNLRAVSRIEATVQTFGTGGVNSKADPTSFSSAFLPLYRLMVANLDETYPELSSRVPGRYLVIAPTRIVENELPGTLQWQRWLDLKQRKGYRMQVVSLRQVRAAVGDSTNTGIRQYIAATYRDATLPDLEYVMLIGDEAGGVVIPAWWRQNPEHSNESAVGDNPNFAVDGSDYLPDVIGGRLSAGTTDGIFTYLNKAYRYEVEPYIQNTQWLRSVTCVAGNFADAGAYYPVTPVWNVNWARERLLRDGSYSDADTFYYHNTDDPPPGNYRLIIRNDINAGVSLVLYRGWASSQLWQYPEFRIEDVSALNVGQRMPAVFAPVCGSGNFGYPGGPCLGEAFIVGAPATPNTLGGAICYLGASDVHTNTRHNNAVLSGIVEAFLVQGIRSAGALSLAGKLEGWRQFPNERDTEQSLGYYYIFHVMNLLGDPETTLNLGETTAMDITLARPLTVGENLVPVTVTAASVPVAGAVVTARALGEELIHRVITDESGMAMMPLSLPSNAVTVQFTAWKPGHFLKRMDVPVAQVAFDPCVTGVNWTAGDDNLPNPGETCTFTLTVQNRGSSATDLSAVVTSADPRLVINQGSATFGNIAPGQTATSTPLGISLGGDLPDGELPVLAVAFSGGGSVTRSIQVPVAAPEPVVASFTVNDGGNGVLEPGETAEIALTLRNVGHQAASNLTATLYSWDAAISFPDANAAWTSIPVGQSAVSNDHFRASLLGNTTPGRQIIVRLHLMQNGVTLMHTGFVMVAGVVTPTAPSGPDAYGYYAYENIDVGYASTPTYNWTELDPALGGNGIPRVMRDDTMWAMALPRQFTFYGQSFDSIWVCSNGWLSFERASIPEFRNWEIPSPIGPPSMVCPFWDDLIGERFAPNNDSTYNIHYLYDASNATFTIQWRNYNRAGLVAGFPNNDLCAFQVILEFAASGDGSIVFQYHDIANTDGPGTSTNNNYASVGIQDSYHERGLGLTYAGYYLPSVDTLRAGRAIRFTRTPPDNITPAGESPDRNLPQQFALHEAYPNPFNPATELSFDLPASGMTSLRVFDMLGREVAVLVNEYRAAGSYRTVFDAAGLTSGLYFARLTSGTNSQVRKLLLVR